MTRGFRVRQSLTLSSNDLRYMLRTGHGDALRHILRLLVATLLGARGHDERGGQRAVGVRDGGGRGGRLTEARVQHGQLDSQLEGALILETALTEHSARHHTRSMSQCPLQNRSTTHWPRSLTCVRTLVTGGNDWLRSEDWAARRHHEGSCEHVRARGVGGPATLKWRRAIGPPAAWRG